MSHRRYFFSTWLLVLSNAFTAFVVWYNCRCTYLLQNEQRAASPYSLQAHPDPLPASLSKSDLQQIVLYHKHEAADGSYRTVAAVRATCALPSLEITAGEVTWFEALLNVNERSVCICDKQHPPPVALKELLARNRTLKVNSLMMKRADYDEKPTQRERKSEEDLKRAQRTGELHQTYTSRMLYVITPTHTRLTQKSDLTSLCHTLMLVPNLTWIVVEDSKEETELVAKFLKRCKVESVHLLAQTPPIYQKYSNLNFSRGVRQRNAGLKWVRGHCKRGNCNGVVYFADDDNKYDLRLFDELRKTEAVSVVPVGFSGGLTYEGPRCQGGVAVEWHAAWATERYFTVDMAGFAVSVGKLLDHPSVLIGYTSSKALNISGVNYVGYIARRGHLESSFLFDIGATRQNVECRGVPDEVLVWHVKTENPALPLEDKNTTDTSMEV